MPTVTMSLNDEAYDIFRDIEKGKRSQKVSAAILLWKATIDQLDERIRAEEKTEEEVNE